MEISLFFKSGSSDKVYKASIVKSGDGHVVNFAYGRRGSTLQTGTKTKEPVAYDKAVKIYNDLVQSKIAKGYKEGTEGQAASESTFTHHDSRSTGILPQLLSVVDEDVVNKLLSDKEWWAQPKFDGKRIMVRKIASVVEAINRKGQTVGFPSTIASLESVDADFVIDGELVGEQYYMFDILEHGDSDLRNCSYSDRLHTLKTMFQGFKSQSVTITKTARTTADKIDLFDELTKQEKEGIVLKQADAPYSVGRGSTQVKCKFYSTCSCIATEGREGKRSIGLQLISKGEHIDVGNVTVPANQSIPKAGKIVEIKYLYAHRGGSLYQPILLGVRDDVDISECVLSQLKYKAEEK